MRPKLLKHVEIGMIEYLVQNSQQRITRVWVEQRLYRNSVREQKDDTHQCEVEQFNHLQYNISSMLPINANTIQSF